MVDASDPEHERCAELIVGASPPLVIPAPVLVETEYLLRPASGAFRALLDDIHRGSFAVADLSPEELSRAGEFFDRYADLPLGFVDAAVLVIVERLQSRALATLDRRHFAVVRPAHADALELLPA